MAFLVAILLTSTAFAERFGSETDLTIDGSYYFPGTYTTTPLSNGDVLDTAKHKVTAISNHTILTAMKTRGLISGLTGYRLVLVGRAHMDDGVALFATKAKGTPVPVPSDLLSLSINDGPVNGKMVVGSNAVLKHLSQTTRNLTKLTQANFSGSGMLTQTWTSSPVKNGAVTEVVELVEAAGNVSGPVTATPDSGAGLLSLTFTHSVTVDLTRYGMATTGISTTSVGTTATSSYMVNNTLDFAALSGISNALVINNPGTSTLNGSSLFSSEIVVNNGTFVLAAGSTISFNGPLTINTTTGGTYAGLVVDSVGHITSLPTFTGGIQPNTLVIITRSGVHAYTHESNGAWTPKAL